MGRGFDRWSRGREAACRWGKGRKFGAEEVREDALMAEGDHGGGRRNDRRVVELRGGRDRIMGTRNREHDPVLHRSGRRPAGTAVGRGGIVR